MNYRRPSSPLTSRHRQPADARQRPAAVGDRDRDHDLVGARRVVDHDLHAVEMAAHERRVLVAERNIQRRARPAALLRRRDQRRTLAQNLAHRRAHLWMQDRGRMFEFAVFADRGGLAVALRLGAVDAERRHGLFRQQFAEFLANRNQRAKGLRHSVRRTDFRSRRSPPRAGSAARRVRPISSWVSSTTVTILRMTALIVIGLVSTRSGMHQALYRVSADRPCDPACSIACRPPRRSRHAGAMWRRRSTPPQAACAHTAAPASSAPQSRPPTMRRRRG